VAVLVVLVVLVQALGASAAWGQGAVGPMPPASPPPPPAAVAPALPPPVVAPAPEPAPAPAAEAPAAPRVVAPVPTSDAGLAPSDHDLVVGHVGIEVRRVDAGPFAFDLRSGTGCPMVQTTPCRVTLGALSLRWWQSRNLALSGGLALGFGGGRDMGRALDSYVGLGPVVGLGLLLGNWRHLAVTASPEASFVYFKPGGDSTTSTKVVTVRGLLEGELHFGFAGVPALSVGMATGVGFHWVSVGDARVWSVAVVGPGSVWDVLTNLFVRYYL
jgi:hypothetical protein